MNALKKWYLRTFCIISKEQAKQIGLTHVADCDDTEMHKYKCMSFWKDSKGRQYRVEESYEAIGYY